MIPILYEATETAFLSNGIGRLSDCVSCIVTEERNGEFEAEFVYPLTGRHYAEIIEGRIISCTHDDDGDRQPFVIYRRSAPLDGLVTFNARHVSYMLSNIILEPFTASGVVATLAAIPGASINYNPFTFWTDKATAGEFTLDKPASVRAIMGGEAGSLLDIFGGEYEFDGYTVKLWANRGTASGVAIRYGKNLTDLLQTVDAGGTYNAVCPYWLQEVDGAPVLVTLPEKIVGGTGTPGDVPAVLDLSMDFENEPTVAELRQAAQDFLDNNRPWLPHENITVNFVQLWNTTEYKDVANLQRVRLCDTVSVIYPALGVTATGIKVIKTVYNVLSDRYDSIELGTPTPSFADTIAADVGRQVKQVEENAKGALDNAIAAATELITGGSGGYVVIVRDPDGKPEEILIMDAATLGTATNIIRMNQNGIGFSNDGGNTYRTAWTINGHFVADFIDTGKLTAITIQGPTAATFWNLSNGELQSAGTKTVTAQVETASGTYTPVTYTVAVKDRLYNGLFTVNGEHSGNAETLYSSMGVSGEGMDFSFYDQLPDDIPGRSTSYVYGALTTRGDEVAGVGGHTVHEEDDPEPDTTEAIKYKPGGILGPDFIELGRAEEITLDDGSAFPSTHAPDRNVVRVSGGWVTRDESIKFLKYYDFEKITGSLPITYNREFYDNPIVNRAVWDYAAGDRAEGENLYIAAQYANSKKDFHFTIPLSRPVSKDVTIVEFWGHIAGAYNGSGTSIASGISIPGDMEVIRAKPGEAGVEIWLRRSSAFSPGTVNSCLILIFDAWGFNFY